MDPCAAKNCPLFKQMDTDAYHVHPTCGEDRTVVEICKQLNKLFF